MDRLKRYVLALLILFLFVGLVVGFRPFLKAYIIEPVALLCWAVWRIVSSVDQNIYWILLIVFCAILVVRLVPSGNDKTPSSAYNYTYESLNRVEYWRTILEDAVLGKTESEDLRESLKKLLIDVVAQTERSDLTESEKIIAIEKVSLPPAAHRYLFPPMGKYGMFSISHQPNITFFVPRWLRKRARMFIHQDNTLIDEILKWMEADLEISTELEINYEK